MNITDELNAAIQQDKTQWQKVEQKVSSHYPCESAGLNALFTLAEQFAQVVQNVEAKSRRFSTFSRMLMLILRFALKTGLLRLGLNKAIRKSNARPKSIAQ